jgi:hypothetical protein
LIFQLSPRLAGRTQSVLLAFSTNPGLHFTAAGDGSYSRLMGHRLVLIARLIANQYLCHDRPPMARQLPAPSQTRNVQSSSAGASFWGSAGASGLITSSSTWDTLSPDDDPDVLPDEPLVAWSSVLSTGVPSGFNPGGGHDMHLIQEVTGERGGSVQGGSALAGMGSHEREHTRLC